jgi:phosphoribosylaminoimidazole-succinocarboxamide synthase
MSESTGTRPIKGELLHEGKAKRVFLTDQKDRYIQEFKNDATAFDGTKKGTIEGKGSVNCQVSTRMFKLLESKGVTTHFVDILSDNEMSILPVKIIKVEVVVRNIAAGSLVKVRGFKEGTKLDPTIVEWYLKDDSLHDPLLNDDHVYALGLADSHELAGLKKDALKINDILGEFFGSIGINLVDFKLEFGRRPDKKIILADEISPDTCRLWDKKTGMKLDKDRFRFDLGNVEDAYQEILKRTSAVS